MPKMYECPACGKRTVRRGWAGHRRRCVVTDDEIMVSRLDLNGPGGCWIWTDYTNNMGYGAMTYEGRPMVAVHRLLYQLANGSVPDDVWVLHRCDVPRCCNPAHLYLGNDADNTRDKVLRGRFHSKLTAEAVREIRGSTLTSRELAEKFGVKYGAIWCVRTGRKWTHI